MKWFYLISVGIVALLALSPLAFLMRHSDTEYEGRIVRYDSYGSEIKSIDPATCGDTTSAGIQGNFYEGLYTYHYLKGPVEVIEQLADEMPQVSSDGLTYTIKLKKDVKYFRNPCFGVGAGQRQGGPVARRRRPARTAVGAT